MKGKRWLSFLVCAAMMISLVPTGGALAEVTSVQEIDAGRDTRWLTTYGRTYTQDDALYLYWTNSGFSFRFNGTGAVADVTADNQTDIYWGYLNVYVDGEFVPSRTICLDKATQTVTLAENLTPGEHTVEVRKRNEAAYGGSSTVGVKTLRVTGGELLEPPAAPTRTIEVIGDSITGGFGNIDPDGSYPMYTTALEDGTMTYAVLAAKQLGANASIVSRSGIGFCRGSETTDSIYTYYDKAASLPGKTGNAEEWDFAANPSDVVVINLGTNDNGAKIGGQPISDAKMTDEAVALLRLVREKNPQAVIIWTYGLMGDGRRAALSAAVDTLAREGDEKVFYLPLDNYVTATEGIGTHGHPAVQAHVNRSAVLAQFIAEKTGWARDDKALLRAQLQVSAKLNNEEALAPYTPLTAAKFTDAYAAGERVLADGGDGDAAAAAVWQAALGLVAAEEMSAEYVVIDTFDSTAGIQFGAGKGAVDDADCKEGEGCVSVTGSSGLVCANREGYNIPLPADWQDWYLEGWVYVSDPAALPNECCLEVSEKIDNIEIAWAGRSLGLKAGWNKIQLKLGASDTNISKEKMTALKNIRFYMVNVQQPLTLKLDQFVLARGKAAANITAWQAAMDEAQTLLAAGDNAELRAAFEQAKTTVTQADVDNFTARLQVAIAAAKQSEDTSVSEIDAGRDAQWITTYGRTYAAKNGVLNLFWTNSGLAFRFNGTGATARMTVDNLNEPYPAYVHVYVDGAFEPSQTICLNRATQTVTLAENLTPGEHTVELRKRSEPVPGGNTTVGVRTVRIIDGAFCEPPARAEHTIEVIGDSITCGFGNIATDADTNFSTHTEDGTLTYAALAAKELGADLSVVARSGIGFCRGSETTGSFYGCYDKTAALPDKVACGDEWDFAANPRDVVVINLGTNDNGAKINGQPISDETMTDEAVAFLRLVREKNPQAVIIWTYGMMGGARHAALSAAVKRLADEGDEKVFYLPLESYVSATEGVQLGHPTVQTDINRSIVLARFIAEKTGWAVDVRPMLLAQLQNSAPYTHEDVLKNYTEDTARAFTDAYAAGKTLAADDTATGEALQSAAEAIWHAQWDLLALSEISDKYTVIHSMDSKAGWSIGGAGGVDADCMEGAGCLYTTWNGGSMVNINTSALNVSLPEDWQDWYLECWMYVDHPENIPSGSCIEISQIVDNIEVQWGLDGLGLTSGWNKVQLRMGGGSVSNGDQFKTVKNLRMFIVNMTEGPLTFKVDNIVLSRGKVAANTTAWQAALDEAQTLLAAGENADLRAALERANTAVTQADVDAFTVQLQAAIEAAKVAPQTLLGDVNDDGKVDSGDALQLLRYAAEIISAEDITMDAADLNGDGKVDSGDALLSLQYAAEIIDHFPAES